MNHMTNPQRSFNFASCFGLNFSPLVCLVATAVIFFGSHAAAQNTSVTNHNYWAVEDAAASVSFARLVAFPAILLLVFGGIWLADRRAGPAAAEGRI